MQELEQAIAEIKTALPGMKLMEHEPLSAHCSFRIGGPARAIAVPGDMTSLTKLCAILKRHGLMPLMLGNGTNLLFPDEGLDNVLLLSTEKLQKLYRMPGERIYAEAGVPLTRLAAFAQQNGLKGLEFASGIPGTVGGGLRMNAGAYGGEMKDAVESVVYLYLPEQALYEMPRENCDFGYRGSIFSCYGGFAIVSAVFQLQPGDKNEIAASMRALNDKRREKQPLDLPSAGSAFKRPEGHFAAALIDEAGLKGLRIGGAQVSEKHAGFVVNAGGACAKDVVELLQEVRARVYAKSGIVLEPEIVVLPPDYCLRDTSPADTGNRVTINEEMPSPRGEGGIRRPPQAE